MKKSLPLITLMLFVLALFISCSGNSLEERCGSNWSPAVELDSEINALTAALTAYSMDQSTANCEAYKDAYQDYIDALRDWEDCYVHVGLKDEFNQSLDDAEESLDELDCQ